MYMKGMVNPPDSLLVVIDIQDRLMPVIYQADRVFSNTQKLIDGFHALQADIIVTEQYPKGLGKTCPEIVFSSQTPVIEKTSFSCLQNSYFGDHLKSKKSLILCGVEAHICVLKTALDAVNQGFDVHVVADAVSSREEYNKLIALERMKQSGVYLTTVESILFQMIDFAGTDAFKAISRIIR